MGLLVRLFMSITEASFYFLTLDDGLARKMICSQNWRSQSYADFLVKPSKCSVC